MNNYTCYLDNKRMIRYGQTDVNVVFHGRTDGRLVIITLTDSEVLTILILTLLKLNKKIILNYLNKVQ